MPAARVQASHPPSDPHVSFIRRSWRVAAVACVAGLVLAPASAGADSIESHLEELSSQVGACETAFGETLSDGADCLIGQGLNYLLDEGAQRVREYGMQAFGPHFQVVANPAASMLGDGVRLGGELDVVIPFAGDTSPALSEPSTSALFVQQGITRWWDGEGQLHNDLRYGLVYRFRMGGQADADILGVSLLQQHNVESQHEVLVSGIDYQGRFGNGSFRYYSPTTGWRTNRLGQKERALEGVEFGTRLDLTTTLRMQATGYRWQAEDGSGRWTDGVRLGFGLRPHPWLNLTGEYDHANTREGGLSLHAGLRIPFGQLSRPPRWQGLGVAEDTSTSDESQLWRPVEDTGRIRVATLSEVAGISGEVEIYFLQDEASSGSMVELEVVLSYAAEADTTLEVRLVPGSGDNPAVPGVDFVDEPVQMVISQGASSGRVSIQLLQNNDQQENRSLSATVSVVT
ncbi:MAG: hypothetical protein F4Y53_06350 [Proteobacteria bacterium]|nr:hypothetical protein [Pseudomonadota bacterium]